MPTRIIAYSLQYRYYNNWDIKISIKDLHQKGTACTSRTEEEYIHIQSVTSTSLEKVQFLHTDCHGTIRYSVGLVLAFSPSPPPTPMIWGNFTTSGVYVPTYRYFRSVELYAQINFVSRTSQKNFLDKEIYRFHFNLISDVRISK